LTIERVDERTVRAYFDALDPLVRPETVLYVFGGAAVALLGSRIRTTMDIDVAEPYSVMDRAAFCAASAEAGLPVNPSPEYGAAFLELVGPLRLSLPRPDPSVPAVELYRGRNLTVRTGSAADLVASKLVRYDEQDQQDIQFLMGEGGATLEDVKASVARLQPVFRNDALVKENLAKLETDLQVWGGAG